MDKRRVIEARASRQVLAENLKMCGGGLCQHPCAGLLRELALHGNLYKRGGAAGPDSHSGRESGVM